MIDKSAKEIERSHTQPKMDMHERVDKSAACQSTSVNTKQKQKHSPDATVGVTATDTALSSECKRCMDNLVSTLTSIQSKPMKIFRSMGVEVNDNIFSSFEKHGSGASIVVTIPQQQNHNKNKQQRHVYDNFKIADVAKEGFGGGAGSSVSTNIRNENSNRNNHNSGDGTRNGTSSNNNGEGIMNKIKRSIATTNTCTSQSQPIGLATSAAANTKNSQIQSQSATSKSSPGIKLQISCQPCGTTGAEGGARAYVKGPSPLSIVLCSNRLDLSTPSETEEVLVHELIHVYDVHHRKWDLTNCHTLAKSEVRAAREAECSAGTGASVGFLKKYCVKDKARVATRNMFPDLGDRCVGEVFEEAFRDRAPFGQEGSSSRTGNGNGARGGEGDGGGNPFEGKSFRSTYPSDQ